jgi:hypothetical protein
MFVGFQNIVEQKISFSGKLWRRKPSIFQNIVEQEVLSFIVSCATEILGLQDIAK